MTEAVCLAFLLVGSFFSFPWTHRTYIHYCFAFVANAAYFAIGLRAAVLVLIAGAIGAIIQGARARWTERGSYPETVGRVTSLVCAALASAFAMCVTHAVRTSLGMREYPLPFGRPGDVGRFMLSLLVLYVAFTLTKEGLLLLRRGALEKIDRSPAVETSQSLYALGGIVGAPMQFAAYAVYARDTLFAWSCVMLWSLLVNAVIAREVARMRHVGALMRELAAKERLAAIGEVTARIVHQTRHQLGLIGIIVHRIERRIAALPKDDAVVVRGELGKLGEVQDELRQMLARDLRGEARPESGAERHIRVARAIRRRTPRGARGIPRSAPRGARAHPRRIERAARRHERGPGLLQRDRERDCRRATRGVHRRHGARRRPRRLDRRRRARHDRRGRSARGGAVRHDEARRHGDGAPDRARGRGGRGGVLRIGNLAEGGLSVAFVFPLGTPSRPIVT